jgi:hypothetical protein
MMIAIPINEMSDEVVINFSSTSDGVFDCINHIKPKLATFKKVIRRLGQDNVVYAIQYILNMMKNIILCPTRDVKCKNRLQI